MTRTDRPDEVPQSRSDKAPASSPVASRDVLREAGIEWMPLHNDHRWPTDDRVVIRRSDVERLIAERDEADEALKAIVALRNTKIQGTSAPQTAGREATSEDRRQLVEEIKDELHKQLECWRRADGELAEDGVLDNIIALFGSRYDVFRTAGTAGEPAPLLSGKFTDSHLRSLKLMVAFHEANAEHVGGFDHVTQAKQAIALLGEALHPTDPAGEVPTSGAIHGPFCEKDCSCGQGNVAADPSGERVTDEDVDAGISAFYLTPERAIPKVVREDTVVRQQMRRVLEDFVARRQRPSVEGGTNG